MKKLDRRELFGCALASSIVAARAADGSESPPSPEKQLLPLIDCNVHLFQWPFRRLPLDETTALVQKLHSMGVQQAWAGSFEGILQRDVSGVNERLATACDRQPNGLLLPFGSINLALPDWQEDLRRCHAVHRMPGIRLHPNYHDYALDHPAFEELMRRAADHQMIVQIASAMEDRRTQHPLLQVPDVDLSPLPSIVGRIRGARVMLLNFQATGTVLQKLAATPGVYLDMARVEATDGIARVLAAMPPDRLVFGTHAPFLTYEAALIKLAESTLSESQRRNVLYQNAKQLLANGSVSEAS